MAYDNLNHFKSVTAHKFFVAPADNDYLLTRWMLLNSFPEFFWHASQALEKYLKAGLILNGESVIGESHKLCDLYSKHCEVFGDLAFTKFIAPAELNTELWQDIKLWSDIDVKKFVCSIGRMGHPDSRYGLTSWSRSPDDLFKLDQIFWALRRLTIGLDWEIGKDFPPNQSLKTHMGKTYRELLAKDPSVLPRGSISDLEKKIHELGSTRGDILHSWNFDFRRNQGDLTKKAPPSIAPQIGPFVNSYLYLYWRELERVDVHGDLMVLDPVFKEGMKWLVKTVKLPKDINEKIKSRCS